MHPQPAKSRAYRRISAASVARRATLPSPLLALRDELGCATFVKRGALTLAYHPIQLFWHDQQIRLSPIRAAIMATLIRRGRLSYADTKALVEATDGTAANSAVLVHFIRRQFIAMGARDPIRVVPRWGYVLEVEEDAWGSKAMVLPIRPPLDGAAPAQSSSDTSISTSSSQRRRAISTPRAPA